MTPTNPAEFAQSLWIFLPEWPDRGTAHAALGRWWNDRAFQSNNRANLKFTRAMEDLLVACGAAD